MKNLRAFIFIALITLINTEVTIIISTPSVSTCEGGLAKATFDATLEGSTSLQTISFNMTLVDDASKEYMAACRVELGGNITEDSSSEEIDVSDEESESNDDASDLGDGRTLRILNFNFFLY